MVGKEREENRKKESLHAFFYLSLPTLAHSMPASQRKSPNIIPHHHLV